MCRCKTSTECQQAAVARATHPSPPPQGREIEGGDVEGSLCIKCATPGLARGIYGNPERYMAGYFKPYPGCYFSGDGAYRDNEGHYRITGRVDDVINVKSHRLGTAEVESAMVGSSVCLRPGCVAVTFLPTPCAAER